MQKDDAWQPASISTFEVSKESPYLDSELAPSGNRISYNDKLKSGYEEGLKKAEDELADYKSSLINILNSLLNPLEEFDNEVIDAVVNLSISISKQIIRRELQINSEQVVSIVREAIKMLPLEKSHLTIHLNPKDVNIIRNVFNNDDLTESYSLVEDPSIEPGGCKLASENSIIDATIDSQIAQIAAEILGSQRSKNKSND